HVGMGVSAAVLKAKIDKCHECAVTNVKREACRVANSDSDAVQKMCQVAPIDLADVHIVLLPPWRLRDRALVRSIATTCPVGHAILEKSPILACRPGRCVGENQPRLQAGVCSAVLSYLFCCYGAFGGTILGICTPSA